MEQENNTQISKKWVMIVIGLIILIIVCLALAKLIGKKNNATPTTNKTAQTQEKAKTPELKIKTSTFDVSVLPTGFPSGLPLDKNAKVTKNYTQSASNGVTEAVREYETSQKLADVNTAFTQYFKAQNWTETARVDKLSDGYLVVVVQKGNEQLVLNLSQNSETKVNKVEIKVSVMGNK